MGAARGTVEGRRAVVASSDAGAAVGVRSSAGGRWAAVGGAFESGRGTFECESGGGARSGAIVVE